KLERTDFCTQRFETSDRNSSCIGRDADDRLSRAVLTYIDRYTLVYRPIDTSAMRTLAYSDARESLVASQNACHESRIIDRAPRFVSAHSRRGVCQSDTP